jgi:hypothetical protein
VRSIHKAFSFPNSDGLPVAKCRQDRTAQHVAQANHWMMMSAAIGTRWYSIKYSRVSHPGRPSELIDDSVVGDGLPNKRVGVRHIGAILGLRPEASQRIVPNRVVLCVG